MNHRIQTLATAIGLLFLTFYSASAQTPFTLKQCIGYGLENHRSNNVSENNIRSTQAKLQEARAAYMPAINVNGNRDNNLKVQQSVIPGVPFDRSEDLHVAFTKKYNTVVTAQVDQTNSITEVFGS